MKDVNTMTVGEGERNQGMKINVIGGNEVSITHNDVEYVLSISRAEHGMLSIEKFRAPRELTMDDDGVQGIETDEEREAFADILIEPEVAIVLAQFFGAMACLAHRENLEEA